ncbi:putative Dol-P-Man:Man(7)GlcNAc(2)-PP-Dol alpha-1,6-mannosyltransferase [Hypsibius exemplaris]|uniref:Mannosyltransferase n=1 Tax=Hypsibius exemplaris TaxID=2072580 RepID=A0A1W0WUN5_HYPEX|nr:putative Dol-P-Man:Man(7)GlcNAc(2)-PP-Dol alpha-1,6-mannosyltransferase [Hypsibius exemplaris]
MPKEHSRHAKKPPSLGRNAAKQEAIDAGKKWETPMWRLDYLLSMVMMVHLIACPWTKVEESFNVQAIHDMLFHGTNISQYDHQQFPGPVPRTFLGALAVSAVAVLPKVLAVDLLGSEKIFTLFLARAALHVLVHAALSTFIRAVATQFGRSTATWLVFITASQFHFLFYVSRPLPNVFALPLVILATTAWINGRDRKMIIYAALATIVFRSELCLLFGPMLLMSLIKQTISFRRAFTKAFQFGLLALGLTVLVDSWFWGRPVWPEGEVLWFNTVRNQSSKWGVAPFLWYFYSVIPRFLLTSLPFFVVGLVTSRVMRTILLPFAIFVALYSLLPHKELRFIIYIVPVLNLGAAVGCSHLARINRFWKAVAGLHIPLNVCLTFFFLAVSSRNYLGGDALKQLHSLEPPTASVHVYLDNFSCQNGVSRFLHMNEKWIYNKSEEVRFEEDAPWAAFTHVIAEAKYEQLLATRGFQVVSSLYGFSGFNLTVPRLDEVLNFEWSPVVWIEKVQILKQQKIAT